MPSQHLMGDQTGRVLQMGRLEAFTKIIWALLLAYVALVPFYYLQPARLSLDAATITVWKYLPLILVCGLTLLTAPVGLRSVAAAVRSIPLTVLSSLVVCAALSLLSVAAGAEYPQVGLLKALYYGATGLFLPLLIVAQFTRREAIYIMVHWVVSVAAVVALYGIMVNLSGHDLLWEEAHNAFNPSYSGVTRAGSTLGNPVVAGSYLALCLPFVLWARQTAPTAWRARAYGVCAALVAVGLVLSFSRGAWLAGGAACVVLVWPSRFAVLISARAVWRRPRQLLVFWAICAALLVSLMAMGGHSDAMQRTWSQLAIRVHQTIEWSSTDSHRLAQFGTAWRVLRVHPFLGVGFGNLSRLFDVYKDPSTPPSYIVTTDNMYLMAACETGILGLTGFLFMLGAVGVTLHRTWRSMTARGDRLLLRASLAAFAGFVVNMVGWDALNHPTIRITFWTLVGLSLAVTGCVGGMHTGGHEQDPPT